MNGPSSSAGGSSWAALAPEGGLTAEAVASRLGAYCWVESQVFGLLGGWAPQIPERDAKALVAEHAEHSGWRAQRWFEAIPTGPGYGAEATPPDGGVAVVDRSVALGDGPDGTLEKLAVTYRVLLPRLLAAYTAHLDWSPMVAEASIRRLLALASADLASDLAHGERLLQALTVGAQERRRVLGAMDALDDLVTTNGGLLGPGSVGVRPL